MIAGALFVIVISVVGVRLLHYSFAQTLAGSSEAESGVLSGGTTIISDAAASGGRAIQFGSPPPPIPAMPLGLFEPNNSGNYTFPVTPTYAMQYYGWYEGFQTADAQTAWSNGTEMFAELQSCGNPCDATTNIPLVDITSGKYDTYLTDYANAVKAFNHPVLLTFDHEMNGNWYPWGDTEVTPAQWIAAWQHVTSLISSIAPNASWVWALNVKVDGSNMSDYWPGNGYSNPHVNMVGLDGYLSQSGDSWNSVFAPNVTRIEAASGNAYPFMVTETGVTSADTNSLSQIDDLINGARSVNAKAVMYFDSNQWALTSGQQTEIINDIKP